MSDSIQIQPSPRRGRPQRIAEQIGELSRQLGPSAKLPTVNELCATLDTSRATVDLALGILEERRVITRRRGSGIFTPPIAKRSLIPIFMGIDPTGESVSPFYRLLANSLRILTLERGLRSELFTGYMVSGDRKWFGSWTQNKFFEQLGTEAIFGGVQITGWGVDNDFIERGLPVVGLSSYPEPDKQSVGINLPQLARLGVQALQQNNRHKIALVGSVSNSLGDREAVVPELSSIYGAFANPTAAEVPYEVRGYQIGCELANRLRKNPGELDGLVITDDVLARGVLIGLMRSGITIGRGGDLEVASHVNKGSSMLVGFQQDLIALEIDPADIARKMLGLLDDQLAGAKGGRVELVSPRVISHAMEFSQ